MAGEASSWNNATTITTTRVATTIAPIKYQRSSTFLGGGIGVPCEATKPPGTRFLASLV